jgi:hypothetical protein
MAEVFETYNYTTEQMSAENFYENQGMWTNHAMNIADENKNCIFKFFGVPIEQWQLDMFSVALQITMLFLNIIMISKMSSK